MYTTSTPHQEKEHMMYFNYGDMQLLQPPPPTVEEYFFAGESTETTLQDSSSLTHIYGHDHHNSFLITEPLPPQAGLTNSTLTGFQAFSSNSGSEVYASAFNAGQTHSPPVVETNYNELVANYSHQCPLNGTPALSLGVSGDNNHTTNDLCSENNVDHNIAVESESCKKKMTDNYTIGQRTSIYRGVTRHRWTGRYEAHLWDNSCKKEGQARKGRQVYLGGYDKEEKAARAYDLAALKYWGSTATTNFPTSNYTKELEEMKDATKQEFIASLRRKSSGFSRGASMYRGVTRHHQQGRWQARIGRVAGNKDLYLGTFATEKEAAEAYDIAAIKFRGVNAVTNFEMSHYDIEAIAMSPLPIGGTSKRLKLDEKLDLGATVQAPCTSSSNIGFASTAPHMTNDIPCVAPFDSSASFYYQNFFQSGNHGTSDTLSSVIMSAQPESFHWSHQFY